ncbi:MAG TPA: hypothetical protein VFD98_06700 [Terracidiphilus sp.]|jgi:hypothetical protein|nr:hypothetical protein [Terracidiphilus sp.]
MASFQMDGRYLDGFRRIPRWVALDAAVLIQIVPGAVRSAVGVHQTEMEAGRYGRPSSKLDGLRRIAAELIEVGPIAVGRAGMHRNELRRFRHVLAWDGILRLPGAWADHFRIVSSAEIPGEVEKMVVPKLEKGLAVQLAEQPSGAETEI